MSGGVYGELKFGLWSLTLVHSPLQHDLQVKTVLRWEYVGGHPEGISPGESFNVEPPLWSRTITGTRGPDRPLQCKVFRSPAHSSRCAVRHAPVAHGNPGSQWSQTHISSNLKMCPSWVCATRDRVEQSSDAVHAAAGVATALHIWEVLWEARQRGSCALLGVATRECPLHASGYSALIGGISRFGGGSSRPDSSGMMGKRWAGTLRPEPEKG